MPDKRPDTIIPSKRLILSPFLFLFLALEWQSILSIVSPAINNYSWSQTVWGTLGKLPAVEIETSVSPSVKWGS